MAWRRRICELLFLKFLSVPEFYLLLPDAISNIMQNVKLVATDLDGTFLRNDRSISAANLAALHKLGKRGIIRVAATGRNLQKVCEVLGPEVPFDYIVFSSGAGVYCWREQKHIAAQNIVRSSVQKLLRHFIQKNENFHCFLPVPNNHKHYFYRGHRECEEFERYFNFNRRFAIPLDKDCLPDSEMCQFLVIIREDEAHFACLKSEIEALCPEIRVIRASSPISKGYIWLEIFHRSVSKGNGVLAVCKRHHINPEHTMSVGNDYNDFDLLEFTQHSFLTRNSPYEIRHKYPLMPTNEEDAFAVMVQSLF